MPMHWYYDRLKKINYLAFFLLLLLLSGCRAAGCGCPMY